MEVEGREGGREGHGQHAGPAVSWRRPILSDLLLDSGLDFQLLMN